MKRFAGFGSQIKKHPLGWSLLIGSLFIIGWTLLRFFADKSVFDLVDQQLYARSLVEGMKPETIFGPTSYILKVFFVYIPFELLHLTPRLSLIIMTLIVNLAAYILIALAVRSILRQLKVKIAMPFYIAIMWFGATAGSIFWIEFANSRNIEVAAGLWVVALGLRYIKRFERHVGWLLLAVSTLAFYMDPLQVYMTGVPLVFFVLLTKRSTGQRTIVYLAFGAILVAAYVLATIIVAVAEGLLGVAFVSAGSAAVGAIAALSHFSDSIRSLAIANVRLLGGVVEDGGRLHQVIALGSVAVVFAVWVWQAVKKRLESNLVKFVTVSVVVIEAVYFLSGQAAGGDTSRYLIMLAPVVVITIATLPVKYRLSKVALGAVVLVIVVNAIFLASMIAANWSTRFSQDTSLTTISQYVNAHPGVNFYASMDTALPAIYFNPGLKLHPLACDSNKIQKVIQGPYNVQTILTKQSAVIFDAGHKISNNPQVCTIQNVEDQLGSPGAVEDINPDHTVLIYPSGLLDGLK